MRQSAHITLRLLLTGLFCLALCMLSFPVTAQADLDPDRSGSLTIHCSDTIPLPDGAVFRLYRVAALGADASYTLLPPYSGYPIVIAPDTSAAQWQTMADTLARYTLADQVPALASATAEHGQAVFSALKTGLYLVLGDVLVQDGLRYIPTPTLITVPTQLEGGAWQYDSTINPKWEIEEVETKPLQVIKVWDDGGAADRPRSVTIQLLGNGVLQDTVTLNRANNWRHTWTDLDATMTWTAIEKPVPDGYTVSIQESEGLVIVTNTRQDPPPTPTPPPEYEDPDIPKTGTNWLPTLLLALVGAGLCLMGWLRMRRSN